MRSKQLISTPEILSGQTLVRHKQTFLWCILSVFIWGLIAHAYGFLHCSLSHDYLNAFIATSKEESAKIQVGRFFVPLYRSFFRNALGLPWLIGILGLTWTSAAVFLVCRLFRVRSKLLIVLISGIMTTNISYISQIATYLHEFDANALALLFSVLSAYLWSSEPLAIGEKPHPWLRALGAALCTLVSLGIYQAFFAVTVTLIIGLSLRDLLEMESPKRVFLQGLRGIAILLGGGLLYLLLRRVVYACTGLTPLTRTELFGDGQSILSLFLVKTGLYFWVTNVAHYAYHNMRLPFYVFGLAAVLLLITARRFFKKQYGPARFVLALLLIIAMPFGMICVYFGAKGNNVHEIMIYAVWFFYIFLLLLAYRLHQLRPGIPEKITRAAALVLVVCLLWQNVVLANTAYSKKELEAASTLSTMTRVVSDLEHQDNYEYNQTPVAFFGIFDGNSYLLEYTGIRQISGLEANTSLWGDEVTAYYNTYEAYFKFVLQYKIHLCDEALRQELANDPRVQKMPAYPDKGYIQDIDGVLVVKFPN